LCVRPEPRPIGPGHEQLLPFPLEVAARVN
jgi:hypothetical protein